MKRFLQAVLVAGMVSALAAPVFAGSVLGAITPGTTDTIKFSNVGGTFAHQDVFATSPVTAAVSATETSIGAVVENKASGDIVRATFLQNSIVFGGGKVAFNLNGNPVPTSNELTFSFGNLFETAVAYTAGDAITATGAVSSLDSLTGLTPGGTGLEFTDTNGNGFIEAGGIFDLDGTYGDYNRTAGNLNDRPFLAIYEDSTPDFTSERTPTADNDADGIKVDNYWVGDPNAPVDMDNGGAEANSVRESPVAFTDFSFGGLLALFAFDTVPLQNQIATVTSIDVANPDTNSRVDIVGRNLAGTQPVSNTPCQVELIGGRLFSILAPGSNTFFQMEAHYVFDPTDGSNVTTTMEFEDGATLRGKITVLPIPEPASIALLLSSVLGLGGVRVWRRKS